MNYHITVENLKCGGCASTIKKGISSIYGVEEVLVDVESSLVEVTMKNDVITKVKTKLSKLGYPEVGDKNTTVHKAKSFVSCAIGRFDKNV